MLCIRSLVVKQDSYFTSISLSDPPTIVLLYSDVQFTHRYSKTPSERLFRAFLDIIRITYRIMDSRYTPFVGLMVNNC